MALSNEIARFQALNGTLGRAGLHAMFGNDFEFYACSFELVDGDGRLVDMLIFPVLPENININTKTLSNIKKGSSSVTSLYNSSFVPFQISLNGTFGRKFRLLLGNQDIIAAAINFKERITQAKTLKQGFRAANVFNIKVKTGYGVTKILEGLIESSFLVDDKGRSMKLIFNNLMFNQSHIVEIDNYGFSQTEKGNNMYWNYNVMMRAIAPALQIKPLGKTSIAVIAGLSAINNFVNDFINDNRSSYKKRLKAISEDTLKNNTGIDLETDKGFTNSISSVNGGFGIGGGI